MSNITSVLNATNASAAEQTRKKSDEDFDSLVGTREDFLTILLAQLKHQDPLDPMEGTEFIDSITRLSAVEQDINQTAVLEEIEALLSGQQTNFGTPVSYLDKEIEFITEVIALEEGAAQFSYILEERPDEVFVVIRDIEGNVVRRADGIRDIGKNVMNWDGKDNSGNDLPDGEYFVTVDYAKGKGKDEEITSLATSTKGVVTGANFEDGEVILLVGDIKTSVGNITSIRSLKQLVDSQVD